jgi:hypothetical protein
MLNKFLFILVLQCLSDSMCYSQGNNSKTLLDPKMDVEIQKEDHSLVLPKLKDSNLICTQVRKLWNQYLNSSEDKKFDFANDTNTYVSVLGFDITRLGNVVFSNNKNVYNAFDSVCISVYKSFLSGLQFQPALRKQKRKVKYIDMEATILIEVKQLHVYCSIKTWDPVEELFECL